MSVGLWWLHGGLTVGCSSTKMEANGDRDGGTRRAGEGVRWFLLEYHRSFSSSSSSFFSDQSISKIDFLGCCLFYHESMI